MSYNFYDYKIKLFYCEKDHEYLAFISELPDLSALERTPEEALKELERKFDSYRKKCRENYQPLPEPSGGIEYGEETNRGIPEVLKRRINPDPPGERSEFTYCLTLGHMPLK